MNKKMIFGVVFASLAISFSVFADTLPNFPMSIWGTVKNGVTSITSWTVQVYNGATKVWEISISSNWQYGWNTAFDQKITLNEFTWSLTYKLITGWLTYNLTSTNITRTTPSCPANTSITFTSNVCQYDLNLNSNPPTCDPATVSNWSVNATTCAITCNSGYNLSGNTCVLQSSSSSSSSGGGGWWGGSIQPPTCLDTQLECRAVVWVYKLYRKTWENCQWWNLAKTCTVSADTSTGSTDNWTGGNDTGSNWDNSLGGNENNADGNGWNTDITREDGSHVILHDISNSFAVNYIKELVAKGIANGYDDDTFRPENPSSRIEYLKMVLRSFNIDYSSANTSGVPFLDVNKNSWEAKVIAKALELNIINWDNENFRPTGNISRAESMKMLMIAWWYELDTTAISSFADVTGWAVKYVEKAKQLWVINGQLIDGKLLFRPFDNITRAEVAKILVKIMELI
jgi:hypothetical protein